MNGVAFPVARVLEGIRAAQEVGLRPVKVNMVVRRGVNEASVLPMARYARDRGLTLRLIEFMDVGHSNGWLMEDVVPASKLVEAIAAEFPLYPIAPAYPGEVASRWTYADGAGEIGVVASVTQPFCGACTRARLSAKGELFTCLFAASGMDLRALLRGGASDEEIDEAIAGRWRPAPTVTLNCARRRRRGSSEWRCSRSEGDARGYAGRVEVAPSRNQRGVVRSAMNDCTRRHASADSDANSVAFRSKKLCGAPGYACSSCGTPAADSATPNCSIDWAGMLWSAPPKSPRTAPCISAATSAAPASGRTGASPRAPRRSRSSRQTAAGSRSRSGTPDGHRSRTRWRRAPAPGRPRRAVSRPR